MLPTQNSSFLNTRPSFSVKRAHSALRQQLTEVDESYFRKILDQQGLDATAHVFSLASITLMTNDALEITAAVMRPSALDGAVDSDSNNVRFLLPMQIKPLLPVPLRLKHHQTQMTRQLFLFVKPVEKALLALAKSLMRLFSPGSLNSNLLKSNASHTKSNASLAQWHTLRLTTSDLSTNV